jgi:NADH:ubiquinone oxidoreductase subunit F (NADH-binding)
MSEAGVDGLPTIVQNVETLAYAALIARFGADWYRTAGRGETRGTALVTVSGATPAQRVLEIEYGTPLREVLERAGAQTVPGQAVMLGDSFGAWADVNDCGDLALDPAALRRHGLSFGAGVIALMPAGVCGVWHVAGIMAYMAGESAGQCGPCVFGLRAISDAIGRLADGRPADDDLPRLARWGGELRGRGACAHPDGAAAFLSSGMRLFAGEFALHAQGRCSVAGRAPATPVG